jgi:hypothetical protein
VADRVQKNLIFYPKQNLVLTQALDHCGAFKARRFFAVNDNIPHSIQLERFELYVKLLYEERQKGLHPQQGRPPSISVADMLWNWRLDISIRT